MGYYTYHTLEIVSGDDHKTDWEEEISKSTDGYDNCFEESIKWYDCEKDMKRFSKKHPSVTFLINGTGEESPDIWKAYFKDGKMFKTQAQLIFEEYDESKLQ